MFIDYMTEDNKTEIITKEPEQKIVHIKDPKRVEAGKKLALYHQKAKKALEMEKSRDVTDDYIEDSRDVTDDDIEEGSSSKWMPSMTIVLTIVGISLTALDLYLRWKKSDQSNIKSITQPKIDHNDVKDDKPGRTSMIPIPRIGME